MKKITFANSSRTRLNSILQYGKSILLHNHLTSLVRCLGIMMFLFLLPQSTLSSEFLTSDIKVNVKDNAIITESTNNFVGEDEAGLVLVVPVFTKTFSPDIIGPGSISTLTFVIDNSASIDGLMNIDFTDVLPAGMTIATPANATNSCGATGVLTAPDGGGTISYTGGTLVAGAVCTITVDVTSSAPGVYTNVTGDLTSSEGNSGTATDDLTVDANIPGFSKSFSPASVNIGERSTLTFTIDNTVNPGDMNSLNFSDTLPVGMEVASPANIVIGCSGGSVTALPGGNTITYDYPFTFPALAAGASCTVSIDVIASASGGLVNSSGNLSGLNASFANVTSGKANALLNVVQPADIAITKRFVTNPALPGGTTDLEFTITNRNRDFSATNISFTDDLATVLAGLIATGTPISGCSGTLSGTSLLSFTGGTVPAQGSCTITVPLQIPGAAAPGVYTNVTSTITADINGAAVVGNAATEDLFIEYSPVLTKNFLTDPIEAGGTTTLEFTVTNTSPTSTLTNIAFTDNISAFIGGATISALPAAGSCGAASNFFTTVVVDDIIFNMTGGEIPASSSCTFTVDVTIPLGLDSGVYTNSTSYIAGDFGGSTVFGLPASDDLTVLGIPQLTKSFTDDPVNAGDTVNLEFTIEYDAFATGDATNVSFTDDLNAVIPGLTATGLPLVDVCGTGATLTGSAGDTLLTLSGGTFTPGTSCTFSVPVQVPAGTLPGAYTNNTSALSATVGGIAATGNVATDDLIIGGLDFTKEFIDDPTIPGGLTTLRYTIDNTTVFDATINFFTDNLSGVIPGLAAEAPLPPSPCGGTISGTTFLIVTGGSVLAGTSCTYDVLVRVPPGATSGTYTSTTSSLSAVLNGSALTIPGATDNLVVNSTLLSLSKSFTDDPVAPGSPVTVEYTLTNLDPVNPVTNVSFTDDFDSALTGLTYGSLISNDCGATAAGVGTGLLTVSGGTIAAGGACTIRLSLDTPVVPFGTVVTSTTSGVTGDIGGLTVNGDPASDDLLFQSLVFSKSMAGPIEPGTTTTLTFTITNADPVNTIDQISFTDDLDAFISGTIATVLPANGTCGPLSGMTGTSLLTFSRGSLNPGQTCSFDVTIMVPCGTLNNTYTNTTSTITGDGVIPGMVAPAATADLTVVDITFPTITCPANIAVNVDPGVCGAVVNYTAPVGTDNCPGAVTTQTDTTGLSSGSLFPVGITTLEYTVTDVGGNTTPCSFTITVTDNEDPVITCPVDITVGNDPGVCGAVVTYANPTATDNCSSGGLYGTNSGNGVPSTLYTIDPLTGNATAVGPTGFNSVGGLEYDAGSGQLYGIGRRVSDNMQVLLTIDLSSGVGTEVGVLAPQTGNGGSPVMDMASRPTDNVMFIDAFLGVSCVDFGDINLVTAAVNIIGTTGSCNPGNGMAFSASGTLYRVDVAGGGTLYTTNQTTGADTALATITYTGFPAMTNPRINAMDADGSDVMYVNVNDGAGGGGPNYLGTLNVITGEVTFIGQPVVGMDGLAFASGGGGAVTIAQTDGTGFTSGDVFPVGTTIQEYTVTDASGNTDVCSFTVTVNDTEDPVTTCPADITVGNDAGSCDAVVTFMASATDNCPGVTTSSVPASGSVFPIGTTLVTVTATDVAGNTDVCTFNVTVNDTEDPVVTCPADITVSNDPGQCDAVVTFAPTATDNCPGVTTVSVPASGSVFPVGTTLVTVTATDASGNTDVCTFNVTVNDTEDPVLTCPADITVGNDPGSCDAVVTFMASATDNCPGVTTSSVPASGSVFPIGTTLVTVTATDAAGNTDVCTFNVTVQDMILPTIICSADVTANTDPGLCGAVVIFADPIALDNCGIASVVQTDGLVSGSLFPVGVNTIEFTATDTSGNMSVCTFTITVNDNEPAMAICQDITIQLDANGDATITAADIDGGSSDNCGIMSIAASQTSFDCSHVGANNVTLTVTDDNGNVSTCVAVVTVEDVTMPDVFCTDITVQLDATGSVTIAGMDVDGGSTDACGIASYDLDIDTFDCSNIGLNNVVLTVTDVNGNAASCTAVVTVEDNILPTLVCMDITLELGADGTATITPADVIDTVDDVCGIFSTGVDITNFDCDDIGTPVTVSVFALDNNGNTSLCTAVVTVVDLLEPVLTCPADQTVDPGPTGLFYEVPDYFATGEATAVDNCTDPVVITTQDPAAGTLLPDGVYTVTITATDEYGNTATCTFELTVDSVLGVGDPSFNISTVVLHPVPAKDYIIVANPQGMPLGKMTINDLNGRLIQTIDLTNMGVEKVIDISALETAPYMVIINSDQGRLVKQIMKKD